MNRTNLMEVNSSIRIWSIIKCPPLMTYPTNLNRSLSKTPTVRDRMAPKVWARAELFRSRPQWPTRWRGVPARGSKNCRSRRKTFGVRCNRRKVESEGLRVSIEVQSSRFKVQGDRRPLHVEPNVEL